MPGRAWTAVEKKAYRASFTVGRIVDELWVIIAVGIVIASWSVGDRLGEPWSTIAFLGGFLVLGLGSYWLLPKLLKRTMPSELWNSLPRGRFDGSSPATAPRSYRELFTRWFRKQGV